MATPSVDLKEYPLHSPADPSLPRRAIATLVALASALAAAFVVAPRLLAAIGPGGGFPDQHHLVDALGTAFVEYWRAGDRDFQPGLAKVVDYWFRYNLAKAVLAAILLIVLVTLAVLLWRSFLRAGGLGAGRRIALASGGVLVTTLALFSLVAVLATVQGVVAPFAKLLPMLWDGPTDLRHGDTLEQVRRALADSLGAGGHTSPALDQMVSDFARFHLAMAVMAAIVAVVFIGLSLLCWQRFASTGASDRRPRRVFGSFGVLSAVLSLAMIVVVVANVTTAADSAPALLAAFEGGW